MPEYIFTFPCVLRISSQLFGTSTRISIAHNVERIARFVERQKIPTGVYAVWTLVPNIFSPNIPPIVTIFIRLDVVKKQDLCNQYGADLQQAQWCWFTNAVSEYNKRKLQNSAFGVAPLDGTLNTCWSPGPLHWAASTCCTDPMLRKLIFKIGWNNCSERKMHTNSTKLWSVCLVNIAAHRLFALNPQCTSCQFRDTPGCYRLSSNMLIREIFE